MPHLRDYAGDYCESFFCREAVMSVSFAASKNVSSIGPLGSAGASWKACFQFVSAPLVHMTSLDIQVKSSALVIFLAQNMSEGPG